MTCGCFLLVQVSKPAKTELISNWVNLGEGLQLLSEQSLVEDQGLVRVQFVDRSLDVLLTCKAERKPCQGGSTFQRCT